MSALYYPICRLVAVTVGGALGALLSAGRSALSADVIGLLFVCVVIFTPLSLWLDYAVLTRNSTVQDWLAHGAAAVALGFWVYVAVSATVG